MTSKQHEIMLVAFVVTEKQVLAMGGVELFPIINSLFNGRNRRMEVDVEFDAKGFQSVNDFLLTLAHFVINII